MPKAKPIDVELMKEWFYYDETSPSCLRWKKDSANRFGMKMCRSKDDVAGHLNGDTKYYMLCLMNIRYTTHRVIYALHIDADIPEGIQIDHIDGDRSNNKISNLREVTAKQNSRNQKKHKHNTSGKMGVQYIKYTSKGKEYSYFQASWRKLDGNEQNKRFNIEKYGYEEAFRLACEYRDKMIKELNEQGAGYTERHGAESSKVDS